MSSLTYNAITYDGLSFTNDTATEADTGSVASFTSFPGIQSAVSSPNGIALSWAAVNAGVYGANSSEVVNFNYTVSSTSASTLIDTVGQLYTTDIASGPGISLTAVETIYTTAGSLIGTDTYTLGATNLPTVTLSAAQQTVNVQITLTMAVNATGTSSSSLVVSAFQQSYGTIAAPASATIGSTVWLDSNGNGLDDNGEVGVSGVTVDLLNPTSGAIIATTTTSSAGTYAFTTLAAGTYEVMFVAPTGDIFTTQGVGTNPAVNSSANQSTGLTALITLTAGQTDNTVDAGLQSFSSISVLKLPSKLEVSQGGQETYTYTVTNTGTTALTNITLSDNIGTAAAPIYVTPTLVTTGTNGTLAAGASWTYTETVSGVGGTAGSSLTAAAILQDFNSVIYGTASTGSDIEGAAVVGGNFSGATINSNPSGTLPAGFSALTVFGSTGGNAININNGGHAYVGGTKGASINFNGGGGYIAAPNATISTFSTPLNALSLSLSRLAATGTLPTSGNNEVITATPGANGIAVIDLTAAQLAAIPSFSINLNGASSLILNVSGSSDTFSANDESGTTGAGNIIWNFYNATGTVAINSQIGGTVLATNAAVTNNNQIDGFLAANSLTAQGEIHDIPFVGVLPGTTSITGAADTVTVSAVNPASTKVTASDTKEVQALAAGTDVSVNGTAPGGSLSAAYGNAKTLEFTYTPGNTVSLQQIQAGMASVTGSNSSGLAFLQISNNASPYGSAGTIYFEGSVTTGENIYADAATNVLTNTPVIGGHFSTTAGADLYAYVFSSQQAFLAGTAPIETMTYNTSGSQVMHIGDIVGSLSLTGYVGTTGGHLVS